MKQVILIAVLSFPALIFGSALPGVNVTKIPAIKARASRRVISLPEPSAGAIEVSILVAEHQYFDYHQTMNAAPSTDLGISRVAAAIGEPARARILCCLLDGHARTSTELAAVADVSPSTASVHLSRLMQEQLIKVLAQGKHRYYSLQGSEVASAMEALSVLAGNSREKFVPNTPNYLRAARTCYDHIAGTLGVGLCDRLRTLGWLVESANGEEAYDVTANGAKQFAALGIDVAATRMLRRRFAFACLDWSERRSHLGGAMGAALLHVALKRQWVLQDPGDRALSITSLGRREMQSRFGLQVGS